MVPIYPCSMEKELGDYERSVTLKRKEGILVPPGGHTVGIAGSTFYFLNECDAPIGVNFGYDRPLNLFHCQRADYDRHIENQFGLKIAEIQKRHEREIKELKAKHKADIAAKAPLSKATLKWLVKTIKKAVKHEDIIVDCCHKESEIELRCRKNHESWPSDLTATKSKRRKSEDELMYILNAIKSELPQLEEKLGVK